ncbi:DUF3821 domain-containing protein [Methanocalculus taiwanensis]|nr:DUF3821 domain-containing protein [Methanocalculus taiwanensis]
MGNREIIRYWAIIWGICFLAFLQINPAMAAITDIPAGGTVFIGEEALNITACGVNDGDTLGWFTAGGIPATGNPTATIQVSDASSFYVAPQTFQGKTGTWYSMRTGNPAIMVADPNLSIRIYDVGYGQIDRTGLWVPMDFELQFRIETNLHAMALRPGVSGAPIEVRVNQQDGIEYSSLTNRAGVATPLFFAVDTNPYMTGSIWYPDAGYSRGEYDFYAFCNANRMKDNYEISGRTVTPKSGTIALSRTTTPTPTSPPVTVIPRTDSPVTPPTVETTKTPEPTPISTPEPTKLPTPEPTPAPLAFATSLGALAVITHLRLRNK